MPILLGLRSSAYQHKTIPSGPFAASPSNAAAEVAIARLAGQATRCASCRSISTAVHNKTPLCNSPKAGVARPTLDLLCMRRAPIRVASSVCDPSRPARLTLTQTSSGNGRVLTGESLLTGDDSTTSTSLLHAHDDNNGTSSCPGRKVLGKNTRALTLWTCAKPQTVTPACSSTRPIVATLQ